MPRYYRNAAGQQVSEFSKAELSDLRPIGQETEEEARQRRLREEAEALEQELAQIDDEAELETENDTLEQRVERLRAEVVARRSAASADTTKQHQMIGDQPMNTDLHALKTLDTLAKSASSNHAHIEKSAGDLMETRAQSISKSNGVPMIEAHRIASKSDDIYKEAYRLCISSHERAVQQQGMVDGMGAFY